MTDKNEKTSKALAEDTVCKKCGSKRLKVDFGFNYHFHCYSCKAKTNIKKLRCSKCGENAKLKKSGQSFFVSCKSCQTEELFFENKTLQRHEKVGTTESTKTKTQARKDKKAIKSGEVENPCPECGHNMLERTIERGANKGKKYMGCSGFPKCKHKEPCD